MEKEVTKCVVLFGKYVEIKFKKSPEESKIYFRII